MDFQKRSISSIFENHLKYALNLYIFKINKKNVAAVAFQKSGCAAYVLGRLKPNQKVKGIKSSMIIKSSFLETLKWLFLTIKSLNDSISSIKNYENDH